MRASAAIRSTPPASVDHANISTSSRYLRPSKLARLTTIQRIDAHRRERGDAAKWEHDQAELRENLQQEPQKGPHADRIVRQREGGNCIPTYNHSFGRLAQLVRARASHAPQLKGRMLEAVGCIQLLACALRVVSGRLDAFPARGATRTPHEFSTREPVAVR
jgi:hypothetical protein